MPIHADFGEFFGGLTPNCSRILSRPPKGTSLAGNARFGVYIAPIGQEMRPGRAAEDSKKKERKRKETKRPHTLRYSHQSCHVGWGPGRNKIGSGVFAP